jgi:diguanylate cyclase (GGDEF)-like protein
MLLFIKSLIANFSVLFTAIYLTKKIKVIKWGAIISWRERWFYIFRFVLVALVCMFYPCWIEGNRFHFRVVPIFIAGYLGDFWVGVITGIIIGLYRLLLGGGGAISGFWVAVFAGLIGGLSGSSVVRFRWRRLAGLALSCQVIIYFIAIGLNPSLRVTSYIGQLWIFHLILNFLGIVLIYWLIMDYLKLYRSYDQVRELADTDELTRLHNRRYLNGKIQQMIERCTIKNRPLAIILLDVDNFKQVNDYYGHLTGDRALKVCGKILKESVRPSDLVVRYGGEEFVVVLSDVSLSEAEQIAERIRAKVAEQKVSIYGSSETIGITVSIGLVVFPWGGTSAEELLHNADLALFSAKRQGKNRVVTGCSKQS